MALIAAPRLSNLNLSGLIVEGRVMT